VTTHRKLLDRATLEANLRTVDADTRRRMLEMIATVDPALAAEFTAKYVREPDPLTPSDRRALERAQAKRDRKAAALRARFAACEARR